MSGTKIVGLVLLILSIPSILIGIVYLFSDLDAVPPIVPDDRQTSGYVTVGLGALLLVVGIVLMLVAPRKRAAVMAAPAPAPQQQFEIKRTEMNWGAAQSRSVADDLQAKMDEVNQKLSRIKVQYGMGELSNESYRTLTQQYEQEKAVIERQILERQGH